MTLVYADRVVETTTTTGTGAYDLAGAKTGFQGFVAGIGDGNTCYYCASDGTDWEVGLGTLTDADPDTLSRDTILASSNADSEVDWGAGSKDIFCTPPAAAVLVIDTNGHVLMADGTRIETDEIRARDGDGLGLYDDAGNGIFVKDGGNVGIGTTGPNAPLSFGTGLGTKIALYDNGASQQYGFGIQSSVLQIYANSSSDRVGIGYFNGSSVNFVESLTVKNGNVGIGTMGPNQKLTVEGTADLKEQSAAGDDNAGYGQIWVKDSTPNELYFTDDAGTDTQISAHPKDAPTQLYTHGPGLDWIDKRVLNYKGEIHWTSLDGTRIVESFAEYNARRADTPGHVDLVEKDWDARQQGRRPCTRLASYSTRPGGSSTSA